MKSPLPSSETTIVLPLYPETVLDIRFFHSVQNASYILERLKAGDETYAHTFIDASMILSVEQILAAVTRAIRDKNSGMIKTRSVASEIIYSLSPNKNITEALNMFGIKKDSTTLVCVTVDMVNGFPQELVKGVEGPLTSAVLSQGCDVARLKTVYKIDKTVTDEKEIAMQVLIGIAMRGNM